MIGEYCRHNALAKCFRPEPAQGCLFNGELQCYQASLYLAQKELARMKEKRNLKHTEASIKWRNQAFYYKRRFKALMAYLEIRGVKLPNLDTIFGLESDIPEIYPTARDGVVKLGESDEQKPVCISNTAEAQQPARIPGTVNTGNIGNQASGPVV